MSTTMIKVVAAIFFAIWVLAGWYWLGRNPHKDGEE